MISVRLLQFNLGQHSSVKGTKKDMVSAICLLIKSLFTPSSALAHIAILVYH